MFPYGDSEPNVIEALVISPIEAVPGEKVSPMAAERDHAWRVAVREGRSCFRR
jgi:hypothetical protein